eukprot:379155-Pleurochrysis_carterae.AAC.1
MKNCKDQYDVTICSGVPYKLRSSSPVAACTTTTICSSLRGKCRTPTHRLARVLCCYSHDFASAGSI